MRDIVIGASLGALIGFLVGLAVSEVVGSVIAGLVALLTAFFGLQEGNSILRPATPQRIVAFSAAAVLAVLLGITIRTHDVLAPSLKMRALAWQEVGVDKKTAGEIVVFERLGVMPVSWTTTVDAIQAAKERSTVLFANKIANSCDTLTGREYLTVESLYDALIAEGSIWEKFAVSVPSTLGKEERSKILQAAITLRCDSN